MLRTRENMNKLFLIITLVFFSIFMMGYFGKSISANAVDYPDGTTSSRYAHTTIYYLPKLDDTKPRDVTIIYNETDESLNTAMMEVEIVTAGNPNEYTYNWLVRKSASSAWESTGVTTRQISLNRLGKHHNGYQFCCKVLNAAGTVTSRIATLTVYYKPELENLQSVYVNEHETAEFEVKIAVAGNPATYSCEWQEMATNSSEWKRVTDSSPNDAFLELKDVLRTYDGYKYRAIISNTAGEIISSAATLYVFWMPDVRLNEVEVVNAGYPAQYPVQVTTAGNPVTYSYKWYMKKAGTNTFEFMPDQGTESLTLTNVDLTDNGNQYYCEVTNRAGTVRTNTMTLDVRFTPILSEIKDITVIDGNTASFNVSIVRDGNPTDYKYQWYENDKVISGATQPSYTTPKTTAAMNQNKYHCVVSTTSGSVKTNVATLTVYYKPILANMGEFIFTEGNVATLKTEIITHGNPQEYTYQWYKNGKAISGATDTAYTIGVVDRTMMNDEYHYTVTNAAGVATSQKAILNIWHCPVLNILQDVTVIDGQAATFTGSIKEKGNPDSYTYEWYYRTDENSEWKMISEAGNITYTIGKTTGSMDGYQYKLRVKNAAGYIETNVATLTVYYLPLVSINGDQIIIEGNSVTFESSIVQHGNPAVYGYQWFRKGSDDTNWTKIDGATRSTYTIDSVDRSLHRYQYRCEVHNAAGDITTQPATLYVYWLPDVTNPNNATVIEGNSTSFNVSITTAGNPEVYSYQWYENGQAIAGATEDTYEIEFARASMNGNKYHCTVTNAAGVVTTKQALLTVYYLPVLDGPSDKTVIEGKDTSFSVSVATHGNPQAYTYKWFYREGSKTGWIEIANSNSNIINLKAVTRTMDGYQYLCQVTNKAGIQNSSIATLTVHYLPEISSPYNISVVEGETAEFDVVITKHGSPKDYHYQWQYRADSNGEWQNVTTGTGMQTAKYTTANTTLDMDKYQYRCMVTNAAGTVVTAKYATLRVFKALEITGKTTVTEGLVLELGVNDMEGATFEVSDSSMAKLTVDRTNKKLILQTFDGHSGQFTLSAIRDENGDRLDVTINVIEKVMVSLKADYIGPDVLIELHYDKADVKMVIGYNNGTTKTILGTEPGVTINDTLVTIIGENHYVAKYNEFTAEYVVIGLRPTVTSIKVTKPPVKTEYGIGENFSTEAMVVTAYYDNNTSKAVTNYAIVGSPIVSGQKYVTVVYEENGTTVTTTTPIVVDEDTEVIYPGNNGWISFYELYRFENISFRSKTTMDKHPESNGWIDVTQEKATEYKEASIKAGYGFELKVYTNYYTNRSSRIEGTISTNMWEESYVDNTSGETIYNYSTIYPLVTSIKNPDVLYIKIYNRATGEETKFVTNTEDDTFIRMEKTNNPSTLEELNGNEELAATALESRWDNSTKVFELEEREVFEGHPERKIYTDSAIYNNGGDNQYVVTIISPIWYGYDWEAGTNEYGYFVKNYTSKAYSNGAGSLQICMSFLLNIEANDELHTHILQ